MTYLQRRDDADSYTLDIYLGRVEEHSPGARLGEVSRKLSTHADLALKHLAIAAAGTAARLAPRARAAAGWLADADMALQATARQLRPLPGMQRLGSEQSLALFLACDEAPDSFHARRPAWIGRATSNARRIALTFEHYFTPAWPTVVQARTAATTFMASLAIMCIGLGVLLGNAAASPVSPIGTAARWRPWTSELGTPERPSGLVAAPAAQPENTLTRQSAPDAGPAAAAPAAAPKPIPPGARGALPVGKGMWLWLPDRAEGGNAEAIVAKSKAVGLTHLYVRTGSSKSGFYAQEFLNRILPVAHANGIRVYGWDFPYLRNVEEDVTRSVAAITYTTPDGHRIDGFVADIETGSEGTNITPINAFMFGDKLRKAVGPNYPLISCVPRPSSRLAWFPYAEATVHFDAIAPMVYWLNREPVGDVTEAFQVLAKFGKPIIPVGQAYDGAAEGGRPGVPPRSELMAFMKTAEDLGAPGVSFWSWQHADQQAWDAIKDAPQFVLPAGVGSISTGQVRAYQTLLTSLGFPVAVNGIWDGAMANAVSKYQQAAHLPVTGFIDQQTRAMLLTPFPSPIQPQG